MKRYTSILIGIYLLAGSLFLPLSDFGALPEYASLFRQCQHEDTQMGIEDFYTQHILQIRTLDPFEKKAGTESPHTPIQYQYKVNAPAFIVQHDQFTITPYVVNSKVYSHFDTIDYSFLYNTTLFRPPLG